MRRIFALTMAVLLIAAALIIPAYAEEVPTEPGTEVVTEPMTDLVIEIDTEPVTAVPVDEWIYNIMKQASPEEVELIEQIILGGIDNLDKLGLTGFDRIRIWVEYNTPTVMVIALIFGLIVFIVTNILLKKGVTKSSNRLDSNATALYEAGQEQAEAAMQKMQTCLETALQAAEISKDAQKKVEQEIARSRKVNEALCKTVHFLLECSDLPLSRREEAEAIYRAGMEEDDHDDGQA